MKAWTLVLITAAIGLVACQGQDPGKDYSQVKASANQPYDSARSTQVAKPPPPPEGGTDRRVCAEPQISIKDDSGDRVMQFTEGKEKTFEITVRSFMSDDMTIQPAGLNSDFHAQRAKFVAGDKNGSSTVYKFTWTPEKLKNAGQAEVTVLPFTYSSAKLAKFCGNSGKFAINLWVVPAAKGDHK